VAGSKQLSGWLESAGSKRGQWWTRFGWLTTENSGGLNSAATEQGSVADCTLCGFQSPAELQYAETDTRCLQTSENRTISERMQKRDENTFHFLQLRVLPEKLTAPQPLKKFPAFCGTQRFITTFTKTRHLSLH
jgi:hypothetical protein